MQLNCFWLPLKSKHNLGGIKISGSVNSEPKETFKNTFSVAALILIDLLAVSLSLLLAYLIRNYLLAELFPKFITGKLLAQTFDLFWWYPLTFIFILAYEKLYQKRLPFWIEVQALLKAGTISLLLAIVLLYLVQLGDEISRSLVLLTWAFAMLILPIFRYYGKLGLIKLNIWNRPVIIIGNSETIPLISGAFKREKTMGYEVVGCLSSSSTLNDLPKVSPLHSVLPVKSEGEGGLPCLGTIEEAERIIKTGGINDLVITDSGLPAAVLVEMTNKLQPLVNNIILVPDLFGVSLSGIEAAYFFEEQAVLLQIKNRMRSRLNRAVKRGFDLLVGLFINLVCLPVMLLISLAIRVDSPGPPLYVSSRIGRGGKEFSCYKFRTMYEDADRHLHDYLDKNEQACYEWQQYKKLISHDPRVTRVGSILRRFSLDELPQLINVLRGEMTLVGPRPYLPREKEDMTDYAFDILLGKPGLTGLWQVSGRNRLSFNNRLKLDAWYMKNWSLWLDMILLLKTVRVVIKRDGAY